MPSLKDLRNRIRSVRSTQKITSAMKVVAASRLRRAHEQVEAARPYAERMERVLGSLAGRMAGLPGGGQPSPGSGKDELNGVQFLNDMLVRGLEVDGAAARVPDGPGLGVEVDEEAIRALAVPV